MRRTLSLGWKSFPRPFRIAFWAALAGLIVGVTDLGFPVEGFLQTNRNLLRTEQVSGDIVVVAIDDRSIQELGTWPWPRRFHGEIARRLDEMGAARVLFDVEFASQSNPEDDRLFEQALARMERRPTLAVRSRVDPGTGKVIDSFPLPEFRRHADLATIDTRYDYQGNIRSIPYALNHGGDVYPSLGASITGTEGQVGEMFLIDHAIDPKTFHTISAVDVLRGNLQPSLVDGKFVFIGATSDLLGDIHFAPGHGRVPGVYFQAMGAETLKRGIPRTIGWFAPFAMSLLMLLALVKARFRLAIAGLATVILCVLAAPIFLDARLIFTSTVPALVLLVGTATGLIRHRVREIYRKRGATNPISGLPILTALREDETHGAWPLVVAKIHNYAEVATALPESEERALVQQIVSRLKVGNSNLIVYQGDDGIFSWFFDPAQDSTIEGYLDGLHSLFRSAVRLATGAVDLTASFGIDARSGCPVTNRLGSALLAADEAFAQGLRWKQYDAPQIEDMAWKLSLLSQLEGAIEAGDLWVAYQPKVEVGSGKVIGAEALARWTHPDRGEISPLEFIKAAEQSGRIDKLTAFVLGRAVGVAARINREREFNIAVNLSARLIESDALVPMVVNTLARHGLSPDRLTLELTETAALSSDPSALRPLEELRAMGVRISIDDYGTGLSTLEYLKRVPASEIKIDKGFVQNLCRSGSDRIMVNSTIALAHSLGNKVVAEGVEDAQTLKALAEMGCDLVQGYFIGKPMTYKKLLAYLHRHGQEQAA